MTERPYSLLHNLRPDTLVAIGRTGSCTASDLLMEVRRVARALPGAEVEGEVLVVCEDRYRFAVALLAAWFVGRPVALPPNTQRELIHHLASQPNIAFVLRDSDGLPGQDIRALERVDEDDGGAGIPADPLSTALRLAPTQHLATVYTSGSTGQHQACPKTTAQLVGEAMVLADQFGVRPGQRVLATVPPHHIYGLLFGTLVPLVAGACFVRDTPFHAESVAAAARAHAADILVSVPAHLRSLTVLEPGSTPAFSRVFSSGAPLLESTARALRERLSLVVTEVFGSSETGGIAYRIHTAADEPWTPLRGLEVSLHPSGRLLLDSPFLAPDVPRPLACQDRVDLLDDGRFVLRGRVDGVIKIGGKRVAIAELERRLLDVPGVSDAAVASIAVGGARGQKLVAAVALEADARGTPPAALRRELLKWFDPVVVPRRVKVVDALPREANGKLTRRRLLALFEPSPTAAGAGATQREPAKPVRDFVFRSHTVRSRGAAETHEFSVFVPPELVYFNGHFDGHPVLPGVAQMLGLVLDRVGTLASSFGQPRRLQKLKFRRQIRPGDVLKLVLEVDHEVRRVVFELSRDGEPCTTGTVDYAIRASDARRT